MEEKGMKRLLKICRMSDEEFERYLLLIKIEAFINRRSETWKVSIKSMQDKM